MKPKNHGVLLPVSSLPSRHGIGDFGPSSYRFVDWLKSHGYSYWQILPLNPMGPGWSPYLTSSSFAIDFRYISLDLLKDKGLIKGPVPDYFPRSGTARFWKGGDFKKKYLYRAYLEYRKGSMNEISGFRRKNPWVDEFASFMYFKEKNGEENTWDKWPREDQNWFNGHKHAPKEASFRIDYQVFVQWLLFEQWKSVMAYAHKKGIRIIGDIPFYVGYDSADCWFHQDQFDLDPLTHLPKTVGGVPPDYFSKTGQLWGNPCYDFQSMAKDGYSFLINRTMGATRTCDLLRLDHFRAFYDFYAIPYGNPDATIGEWKLGPGTSFFDALYKADPGISIIAEDLGDLSPGVLELRDHYSLPGMNVIQFTFFDPKFKDNGRLVVYSGTHDNDTLWGWYRKLSKKEKLEMGVKLHAKSHVYEAFVDHIRSLPSYITVFSMCDLLRLGSKARLNVPGTVGSPNFEWKLKELPE